MLRTVVLGSFVVGVLTIGLVAQAGAALLAFTSPTLEQETRVASPLPYGEAGPHPVGVRRLGPVDALAGLTVWYPAAADERSGGSTVYSYAVNMLGPDRGTAIATFEGHARSAAAFDGSGGPYPLVVLSHGYAITAGSYAWLAEHLASHGMVVAMPQHRESLDPGALWRSTLDRPRDVRAVFAFVDDAVRPGGPFEGLIDIETVAVVGHSYGGYTALAAVGARLDSDSFGATCDGAYLADDPLVFLCDALLPHLEEMAESAGLGAVPADLWPSWGDDRVDAAVTIAGDAAMFGGDGLARTTAPVMAIGGTADTDSPYQWGTRLTYDSVSSPRKVEVGLEGAAHLVFAGECTSVRRVLRLASLGFCSDPAWDRLRAHDVVKHHVAAFLLAELTADLPAHAALAPATRHIPDITYRAEGY